MTTETTEPNETMQTCVVKSLAERIRKDADLEHRSISSQIEYAVVKYYEAKDAEKKE